MTNKKCNNQTFNPARYNRKPIAVLLAGLFSCAAQLIVPAAQADTDNLHLPARMFPGAAQTSFTRMFPSLPPFAEATDAMREQAKRLGEIGGIIDAMDNLSDPIQSIVNPAVFSPNNPDNPNMTAGVTFFGAVPGSRHHT